MSTEAEKWAINVARIEWEITNQTTFINYRQLLRRFFDMQAKLLEKCNNDTALARKLAQRAYRRMEWGIR